MAFGGLLLCSVFAVLLCHGPYWIHESHYLSQCFITVIIKSMWSSKAHNLFQSPPHTNVGDWVYLLLTQDQTTRNCLNWTRSSSPKSICSQATRPATVESSVHVKMLHPQTLHWGGAGLCGLCIPRHVLPWEAGQNLKQARNVEARAYAADMEKCYCTVLLLIAPKTRSPWVTPTTMTVPSHINH